MDDTLSTIPAVILAGGLSRRMGGGDKTLLSLGGKCLLDHVIARILPQAAPLALNANGDIRRFSRFAIPVLRDSVPGHPGPLAGILAAMDWAATLGAPYVVTVAADTPFLPADLVDRLVEGASGAPVALAATPDPTRGPLRQPTFGLWSVELRDDLRAALDDGVRKVVQWTARHGAADVFFDAPDGADPFFNINTPEDLRLAEARLSRDLPFALYGVTGWKNAGKTGLMERLVAELTSRGLRVSTVKHAHHTFDVDHPGKDSHRHREAGANQVLLVSRNRWALMDELRGAPEPTLSDLLARLSPADIVLIEGYKRDRHPKIEAHRAETDHPLVAPEDNTIRAIASDAPAAMAARIPGRPVFDLDNTSAIADFILEETGLA